MYIFNKIIKQERSGELVVGQLHVVNSSFPSIFATHSSLCDHHASNASFGTLSNSNIELYTDNVRTSRHNYSPWCHRNRTSEI